MRGLAPPSQLPFQEMTGEGRDTIHIEILQQIKRYSDKLLHSQTCLILPGLGTPNP